MKFLTVRLTFPLNKNHVVVPLLYSTRLIEAYIYYGNPTLFSLDFLFQDKGDD